MTYKEQIIKKAIEGGWHKDEQWKVYSVSAHRIYGTAFGDDDAHAEDVQEWDMEETTAFLDPLFWQSLGKALGWGKIIWNAEMLSPRKLIEKYGLGYLYHWHRFIDHLAAGQDAESFFESLLK